mgnify:CR=1 FL=1
MCTIVAMKKFDFIANYRDLMDEDTACYPGSSELLAIGAPVGKKLGLQKIGIHIETIPPGRRTSWPHAEKTEEEFAFVVSGEPSVWINGELQQLKQGDFVAFPSGTGIAHTFINDSDEDAVLLVGGEATKPDNQIFYPLHPERNEQMREKGALWSDIPSQVLGKHDGTPRKR